MVRFNDISKLYNEIVKSKQIDKEGLSGEKCGEVKEGGEVDEQQQLSNLVAHRWNTFNPHPTSSTGVWFLYGLFGMQLSELYCRSLSGFSDFDKSLTNLSFPAISSTLLNRSFLLSFTQSSFVKVEPAVGNFFSTTRFSSSCLLPSSPFLSQAVNKSISFVIYFLPLPAAADLSSETEAKCVLLWFLDPKLMQGTESSVIFLLLKSSNRMTYQQLELKSIRFWFFFRWIIQNPLLNLILLHVRLFCYYVNVKQ